MLIQLRVTVLPLALALGDFSGSAAPIANCPPSFALFLLLSVGAIFPVASPKTLLETIS